MNLIFPRHFQFGTSTAAYQIETAYEHDWQGVVARDGHIFERTTDHEKRYDEDIAIIASLAPHYRMSLMWSRLQRSPLADFDESVKREYHQLLQKLRQKNVSIMMVLHHFTNPVWFARAGGWEKEANIHLWVDFAKKVVDEYGTYISSWNTFNEPNLYTSMGWVAAEFPPFKRNIIAARKVLNNLSKAHGVVYEYIKHKYPHSPVGISHNCTVFAAENMLGIIPAKFYDYMFMEYAPRFFTQTDFFGMSYYARIAFDPLPITNLLTPEKIKRANKPHDEMWEYYPLGLGECIRRYWNQYRKPIIITENGICTHDDTMRVKAIKDYMKVVYDAIQDGADVRGYYHWSAWDNFEWSMGPSYPFGLYGCDINTKNRTRKPSADLYASIAFNHVLNTDVKD